MTQVFFPLPANGKTVNTNFANLSSVTYIKLKLYDRENNMQKLTLRMEPAQVEKAKAYAAHHGKSLSQLVADYFDSLTTAEANEETLPPLTQKLKGALRSANASMIDSDYKKHLEDKYL